MYRDHKFAACLGFLFGALSPVVGLFLGLQISTVLGNIFAFPFIALSTLVGEPIGNLSPLIMAAGILLSGLAWSFVFARVARWRRRSSRY